MTYIFTYGEQMIPGGFTARMKGELRLLADGKPTARFGPVHHGYVYGQVQDYGPTEVQSLTFRHIPEHALRQVATWREEPIFAFVDVQPGFETLEYVPSGQWARIRFDEEGVRELVQKASKVYGPGHKAPGKIRVSVTPKRLDMLHREMTGTIKVDLLRGISSIKQNLTADDMRRAFMSGNYDAVREELGSSIKGVMGKAIDGAIRGVHDALIPTLPTNARAELRYDPSNPRISRYLNTRAGNLITTSEDGMLEAVRAMTTGALATGMSVPQAAATIRDSIGLNAPQARALANYKANLFDQGIPTDRASDLATAYSERLLDQRATMIAGHEVRNAQNVGQLDIWQEGVKADLLPAKSEKQWSTDANPCEEWCEQMDGVTVGLDEPWEVKSTRNGRVQLVQVPSETHPNCYCIMLIVLGEDE